MPEKTFAGARPSQSLPQCVQSSRLRMKPCHLPRRRMTPRPNMHYAETLSHGVLVCQPIKCMLYNDTHDEKRLLKSQREPQTVKLLIGSPRISLARNGPSSGNNPQLSPILMPWVRAAPPMPSPSTIPGAIVPKATFNAVCRFNAASCAAAAAAHQANRATNLDEHQGARIGAAITSSFWASRPACR